jgi:hypothetical protein
MLPKKIKILIHEYQALFSPSHHTRQVNVLDKLLGVHFVFSVTPTQTVEYLKSRIQSRQGQEGLRIIPAHIQLITCRGEECQDDENVTAPPLPVLPPTHTAPPLCPSSLALLSCSPFSAHASLR